MPASDEELRIVYPYYIFSPGALYPEDMSRIFLAREVVANVDGPLGDAISAARKNARKLQDDMSGNELIQRGNTLELQQHRLIKIGSRALGLGWKTIEQMPLSESRTVA